MVFMILGTNSAQEIVEFAPSPLSCDCDFFQLLEGIVKLTIWKVENKYLYLYNSMLCGCSILDCN